MLCLFHAALAYGRAVRDWAGDPETERARVELVEAAARWTHWNESGCPSSVFLVCDVCDELERDRVARARG